jgi:hypothetical protein
VPKPAPLTTGRAGKTLAHKFTGLRDRLYQMETTFGLHSKRVFLVWTRWTGAQRGEGDEVEVTRVELLPTPRVTDLTSVSRTASRFGHVPQGTLRVDNISCGAYTEDHLTGLAVPTVASKGDRVGGTAAEPEIPDNKSFFWDVVEDDRGGGQAQRRKYRLLSAPHRNEGALSWAVTLQPVSDDLRRDGVSKVDDVDVFG